MMVQANNAVSCHKKKRCGLFEKAAAYNSKQLTLNS